VTGVVSLDNRPRFFTDVESFADSSDNYVERLLLECVGTVEDPGNARYEEPFAQESEHPYEL